MKTKIYLLAVAGALFLASCGEEKLDGQSIFPTEIPPKNSFDSWLDENFVDPYNIDVQYKMDDFEIPSSYKFTPPTLENSKKLAYLIKHIFIEPYNEVAKNGSAFMRQYAPRIMTFVGDGNDAAATAAGGLRVTVYYVNNLVFDYELLASTFFKTIHHEFQHILNQTVTVPSDYIKVTQDHVLRDIDDTQAGYLGSSASSESKARDNGYISAYAQYSVSEDLAEMFAWYVVLSPEQWEIRISSGGIIGIGLINKKLGIMKSYMMDNFGVDMDLLREVVRRRMNEIDLLDLENLPF